jgi:hypothetical protein
MRDLIFQPNNRSFQATFKRGVGRAESSEPLCGQCQRQHPVLEGVARSAALEDCWSAFPERFETAEAILAKGQANYEGLSGANKHIFYPLEIQAEVLSQSLGCPVDRLVLPHQGPASTKEEGAS